MYRPRFGQLHGYSATLMATALLLGLFALGLAPERKSSQGSA